MAARAAQLSLNGVLAKYQNKSYKLIFDDLNQKFDFLPVALYRAVPHDTPGEVRGLAYPYVFTSFPRGMNDFRSTCCMQLLMLDHT